MGAKGFDGQVAVVTGASSGLGRRLAVDLAAAGADVVAVARSAGALDELAAAHPPRITPRPADVADTDAVTALLRTIEDERGRVDILVNAAGVEEPTPVEAADLALYESIFATNFFGLVAATLAVVPGMLRRRHGIVVNVSSDHGRAPAPGTPAYSASKAAVSVFTESVAHECHGRGVHLHVLYPGWVPTPLGRGAVDHGMPMPPRAVRRTEAQVAARTLARMGGPTVEINCARVATLAPVLRALAPRLYQRQLRAQAISSSKGGTGHPDAEP